MPTYLKRQNLSHVTAAHLGRGLMIFTKCKITDLQVPDQVQAVEAGNQMETTLSSRDWSQPPHHTITLQVPTVH